MTKARFTEEFKEEAIKQVLERGYTVPDVAKRLGVSAQSLYKWIKVCAPDEKQRFEAEVREVRRENLRLKAELQQVKEDREILKKAAAYLCPVGTSPKTRIEVCVYATEPGKVSDTPHVPNAGGIPQWLLRLVNQAAFKALGRGSSIVAVDSRFTCSKR